MQTILDWLFNVDATDATTGGIMGLILGMLIKNWIANKITSSRPWKWWTNNIWSHVTKLWSGDR